MVLTENDLIASMLKNQAYVDQVTTEMLPDDTLDLLKGTRRGKSEVKGLDHIVGISDLASRQKAKEQRQRAVITNKTVQLQKSFIAFSLLLRKFFVENIDKEHIIMDTQYWGRFTLMRDPDADEDTLYPKKITFEPTGLMSRVIS